MSPAGVSKPGSEGIYQALKQAMAPSLLEVRDDSAQHSGHAGALEGGHYHVTIVCRQFTGLSPLARHRLVYSALAGLMGRGIHALSIDAQLPLDTN